MTTNIIIPTMTQVRVDTDLSHLRPVLGAGELGAGELGAGELECDLAQLIIYEALLPGRIYTYRYMYFYMCILHI